MRSISVTPPAAARSRIIVGRHGESRVAKAVLISAVPPLMVKTDGESFGLPKSVFDGMQAQLAANRSQFLSATCRKGRSTALTGQACKSIEAAIAELVAPGDDGRCQGAL